MIVELENVNGHVELVVSVRNSRLQLWPCADNILVGVGLSQSGLRVGRKAMDGR